MILVIGATGQLGTAVVRKLAAAGTAVRAFVRSTARFEHLIAEEVELAFGDLRDRESLARATRGVTTVIATATTVFPRGRYDFERDELDGYRDLISACEHANVGRFVFVSNKAPYIEPYLTYVPTLRCKRRIEELLEDSAVSQTIFRSAPFMDDYFALIGSSIPLRGEEAPTLKRPFWFSRASLAVTGRMIEHRGLAIVPGRRDARHAFIAVDDVAEYLVREAVGPRAAGETIEIGGPEDLSWAEVVGLYEKLLRRRVRIVESPASGFRLGAKTLRPLSPAAANQMGILWVLAENDLVLGDGQPAERFDIRLTTAEQYLSSKLLVPPQPARSITLAGDRRDYVRAR